MLKPISQLHFLSFIFVFCFTVSPFSKSEAQTSDSDPYYFTVVDLNAAEYASIKSSVTEDGRFEIVEACIPAEIIGVRSLTPFENTEKQTNAFQELVSRNSSLSEVVPMEDFNREKFMARCKEYRTKRP